MMQIKFLSDYADVFLDSEGVESDVFFILSDEQTNLLVRTQSPHPFVSSPASLYVSATSISPTGENERGLMFKS